MLKYMRMFVVFSLY